jgi:hypothetical protein
VLARLVSHDATLITGFSSNSVRSLCLLSYHSSYFTSPRLQTHDKLLHTRHPKRDIFARSCQHVDVDGKRELAIVVCHSFANFSTQLITPRWTRQRTFGELTQLYDHRCRQRLTIQRVKHRIYSAFKVID